MKHTIRFWLLSGIALCSYAAISPAQALPVPDATLPNNSVVTNQNNISTITGGTRAGGNLFHSFSEFTVPTLGVAHFNNAFDIQNIISRVTGASRSTIDGLIQANGKANLFLINPNGFIFDRNASLKIGGSFVASTASSLKFADGTQFSATAPQTTPLLTISVPIGLQFGANPGSIVNRSQVTDSNGNTVGLQVDTGKSLALVGGNVGLDGGSLTALDGRVELGGLAGAGTVGLQFNDNNLGLSYPQQVQRADVSLTNGADVDVTARGGGSIAVNARKVDISGSGLFAGIGKGLKSVNTQAGNIELSAQGELNIANSLIYNLVESQAAGNAGNIDITAGSLSVTNGAQLYTATYGQGNAGSVNIQASGTASFDGINSTGADGISTPSGAFSGVAPGAVGNGGDINIAAGSLYVTNGALDATTNGQGNAGSVNIQASGTASFDGDLTTVRSLVGASGGGNSGGININTGALFVTHGAELNNSITDQGRGQAGDIVINARDQVSFDGGFAFSRLEKGGVGRGGNIYITTGTLSLTGIPSDFADANIGQVDAATFGQGNAGDVIVNARGAVTLDGRGSDILSLVAYDRGIGNGGNIIIDSNSLSVANGARIVSQTESQGNAGSVTITASGPVSFNGVSPSRQSVFTAITASGPVSYNVVSRS